MDMWYTVLIVVHVLLALAIIGLVLLQHGKGADMGSGFGGGASASLFGATGSANFLSRTTAVLASIFFLLSLGLAYVATNKPKAGGGIMDAVKTDRPASEVPLAPGAQKPAPDAAKSGEAAKPAEAAKPGEPPAKPAPSGEPAKAKDVPN